MTCGLVNFAADAHCKRCGTEVANSAVPAPTPPAGIVLADGYVMPPPPSGGVWRDKSTLVMTKEATLPDRCVKCNAPASGLRLKKKFSWHHPILYLLVFGAALLYVIIAAVLSKRATVYLGLCAKHFQSRRKQLVAGWLLLLLGLIIPIAAIAYDYVILGLLGVVILIAAVVWLIVASRVVSVKKIDDRLVWLNGFSRDYLSQLPAWQA